MGDVTLSCGCKLKNVSYYVEYEENSKQYTAVYCPKCTRSLIRHGLLSKAIRSFWEDREKRCSQHLQTSQRHA
jgi:hypothetical protein